MAKYSADFHEMSWKFWIFFGASMIALGLYAHSLEFIVGGSLILIVEAVRGLII